MANAYDSLYTGQHNDQYEIRITNLQTTASALAIKATTFTAQINTLAASTTAISSAVSTVSAAVTAVNSAKVAKAGDTMTGGLNIKDTRITGTVSGNTIYGLGVSLTDTNNTTVARYDSWHTTAQRAVRLYCQDVNSSSTPIWNILTIGFNNSNKSRFVSVSEAKPWREAIGASTYTMVPGSSSQNVSFTTTLSAVTSSWVTVLNNWTAPSNGYLCVYFNSGGNNPSCSITDNTNGFQVRNNGNGGRDWTITIPCAKNHKYTCDCVYAKTNYAKFFPAATGL